MTNQIFLRGFVEQEPDVRYFGHQYVNAVFRLRTEEHLPTPQDPERIIRLWHRISAWGALAEQVERDIHQGMEIGLSGRLTYRKETDRTGITATITEIDCQRIEIIAAAPSAYAQPAAPPAEPDWANYAPTEDEDPMA